nr:MMPL family transporter [Ruficoccus amylovorans]
MASVYVEDAELFSPEKLAILKQLSLDLKKLPQVQREENLFTAKNIRGAGGWVDTSPLLQKLPQTPEAAEREKELALANPLLRRVILSEDGEATLLTLYLKPPTGTESAYDHEVYEGIEEILAGYQGKFDRVFQVGAPAIHVWMGDYILADQKLLLPLSCLILIGLIGLMMGSIQVSIIPVINAAIATIWTLGFMAMVGIPIGMLNYIVPALILIIGATEDVHILNEYRELRDEGAAGLAAIEGIARRIGLTLVLTALTTTLGFAVTGINALTIMQDFGLSAAFGLAARFAVSVIFLPAYLRYFGRFIKAASPHQNGETRQRRLARRFTHIIMTHVVARPKTVMAIFTLIAVPCLFLIPRIRVSNDLLSFLKPDSPILEKLNTVATRLSGSKVAYITLEGEPGEYRQAKKLHQVEQLCQWLRERGDLDKVLSLTDYLALVNSAMFGDDPGQLHVPDKDALVAQYLIFFHRSTLQPYVSGDFSAVNIAIRSNINDSSAFNRLVHEIEDKLNSGAFGRHAFSVTGQSVLAARAVDKIITGQVLSLTSMIVFLFLTVALLFLSCRAGLLTVLSNIFPVVVVFGMMGLTGISLNVGTCMVAAITIGIAVDDTLHLMVRYNRELKVCKEETPAIANSLRAEFFPVMTTSLGLAGGFLVLGCSSFLPVMEFGLLSAFVMLLAFAADIILTPVLLSTTRLITLWDVIGFNLRKTLIESSPVFQGMTRWQAKKLILLANLEDCEPGRHIIREGEHGHQMYVVIDGEFEVSKGIDEKKVVLSTLALGDVVGEVGLVSRVRRTADVTARTQGKLLVLDWESLVKLQRSSPFISSKLFLNLSRVLGMRLNDSLARINTQHPFPPKN